MASSVSLTYIATGGFLVLIFYKLTLICYRLYLHPLAKFPGLKLTAATYLVQIYYDLFHGEGGQFPFAYQRWHDQYGPIIRINPDELHIRDSSFHETLYSPSLAVRKPKILGESFGAQLSAFGSSEHHVHRSRRGALNPFFSKRKVAEFGPEIQKKMNKILDRLHREYDGTGLVLNLNKTWGCLSSDSIVGFAFEPDRQYNFIESVGFHSLLPEAMEGLLEPLHWILDMPSMGKLLLSLPDWMVKAMDKKMGALVDFKAELASQISHVLQAKSKGEKAGSTLFSSLMDQGLPPQELTLERLQQEAVSIISAGIEATMRSLSLACFHIINKQEVMHRLVAELEEAIPEPKNMPDWDSLSKLPFLSACIEETLRLTYGASYRLQRAYPKGTLEYGGHVIPADTLISMDNYDISHDENIFPDSHSFIPDRWLNNPKAPDGKQLSRYMVSFSKGARSCTGMQLAYAEMYICLANFFRSPLALKARLYETDLSEVKYTRDRFAPKPKIGSQGVRVVFEG